MQFCETRVNKLDPFRQKLLQRQFRHQAAPVLGARAAARRRFRCGYEARQMAALNVYLASALGYHCEANGLAASIACIAPARERRGALYVADC